MRAALAAVLLLGAAGSFAPALAYDPSAAAAYAEAHWNECGVFNKYPCIEKDCTNFASQVLRAGGYPMHNGADDDHHWWLVKSIPGPTYTWSDTWSFSHHLRAFLLWDAPGGTSKGTFPGSTLATDSKAGTGDLIFYDWKSDGHWDHTAAIVTSGFSDTSPSYYGDLVNYHTTNKRHVHWSLRPNNTFWQTTTINPIHISANN